MEEVFRTIGELRKFLYENFEFYLVLDEYSLDNVTRVDFMKNLHDNVFPLVTAYLKNSFPYSGENAEATLDSMEISSVIVYGVLFNTEGYSNDYDDRGFRLDGDDVNKLLLSNAIWYQVSPALGYIHIMNYHAAHLNKIGKDFIPVLRKYGYNPYFSTSQLPNTEARPYTKKNSNPDIVFRKESEDTYVIFETDYLTGRLIMGNLDVTDMNPDEFEMKIISMLELYLNDE